MIWYAYADHIPSNFLKLSSTSSTWFILEYFIPHVPNQYIVDNIAKTLGCSVLQLPPYHCMLNPIEMVWSHIKQHCRRQAIHTNKPSKVLDLIHAVYSTKTSPKNWESIISITCYKGRRKVQKNWSHSWQWNRTNYNQILFFKWKW